MREKWRRSNMAEGSRSITNKSLIDDTMPQRLNLGCGQKHLSQAVNLDIIPDTHPDVIHDLNCIPWPFPDNRFGEVLAYDVIEHLQDFIAVMEEIHRVCRDGAAVRITVPHFYCANAFIDRTHRRYVGYFRMDYVTVDHELPLYTRAMLT